MNRYENVKIRKSIIKRGKKTPLSYENTSKSTTLYSNIPESDNDLYVISQYGDRLDQLANQYYGDVTLWWYIAKANHLKFMTIPPGTRLRIPHSVQFALGR